MDSDGADFCSVCLHMFALFLSVSFTISDCFHMKGVYKKVGFCGCVTEMVLRATQPPSSPQNTDCVGTQIGTISETKKNSPYTKQKNRDITKFCASTLKFVSAVAKLS